MKRVNVFVPIQSGGPYTYSIPETESGNAAETATFARIKPGQIVRIPFGNRSILGVVAGDFESHVGNNLRPEKIKPLLECLDIPPFAASFLAFLVWAARYTCTPFGLFLKTALSPLLTSKPRLVTMYRRAGDTAMTKALSPARWRVRTVSGKDQWMTGQELAHKAKVSPGVIRSMAKEGLLITHKQTPMDEGESWPDLSQPGPNLSPDQQAASDQLNKARGFQPYLLDGVTGSGKTEVYFEAIARAASCHRQSLILMPEIALTTDWLARFGRRFGGVEPFVWHSSLTPAARRRVWRAVITGKAGVVVGARSALFLPFRNLGLIVVDEEHDPAYKQEDGMIYHARDLAVVRARECAIPIILVSATPSLESHINAENGRYHRLRLRERYGNAVLPHMQAIDLTLHPPLPGRWLSPPLIEALETTLERREQALLFLNRRGYAPLTLCRACGHRLNCEDCSAYLVRRRNDVLVCHHCQKTESLPESCPSCGAVGQWASYGPGVERIEKEVEALFPQARCLVLSSDSFNGAAKEARDIFQQITEGEIDILIGTQMIAKGHHFPSLTLVGVVDADMGLEGGDLRAAERTYQLLHQVSGRAGRETRPGQTFLQTYTPHHPVIQALLQGNRDEFLSVEATARQRFSLPPFGRLAAIIVSGKQAATVERHIRSLAAVAERSREMEVFGPAPALMPRLRGHYRWRLLAKTQRHIDLSARIKAWVSRVTPPSGVNIRIDIDPRSFF